MTVGPEGLGLNGQDYVSGTHRADALESPVKPEISDPTKDQKAIDQHLGGKAMIIVEGGIVISKPIAPYSPYPEGISYWPHAYDRGNWQ